MNALKFFTALNVALYCLVAFIAWDPAWITNIAEWGWFQRLLLVLGVITLNMSAVGEPE